MPRGPMLYTRAQIEIRRKHQGKHHALDGHVEDVRQPRGVVLSEGNAGQARDVERERPNWFSQWLHDSLAGIGAGECPRGQSHPIKVTITGGAPTGIAHGVKIDPTNVAEIVIDARKGQMLGPGSSSLCCGSVSRLCVTRVSRMSSRNPTTTGWSGSASHKASRPFTVGGYR